MDTYNDLTYQPMFEDPEWRSLNSQSLMEAIASVRQALDQRLSPPTDQATGGPPADLSPRPTVVFPEGQCSALTALSQIFQLSTFEQQILLLCAGVELSKPIASLCAKIHGDPNQAYATFSLTIALFPQIDWHVLTPKAPLRRWRLLEVGGGTALTTSPLRIDERILHYLLGIQQIDDRLLGVVSESQLLADSMPSVTPEITTLLPPSYQALVQDICQTGFSASRQRSQRPPIVQLCGPDSVTKELLAAIASRQTGRTLYVVLADVMPVELSQGHLLQSLCEREMRLTDGALLMDCDHLTEAASGENAIAPLNGVVNRLVDQVQCPVMVMSRDRRPQRQRSVVTLDVHPPTPIEQQHLWEQGLAATIGEASMAQLNGHITQLVANFNLSPSAIQTVIQQVEIKAEGRRQKAEGELGSGGAGERGSGEAAEVQANIQNSISPQIPKQSAESAKSADNFPTPQLFNHLWRTCLAQARPRLNDLAQPIRSTVEWDDLVLPDKEKAVLKTMHAHVKQRSAVYEDWGFASKSRRGLGISALFAGASGTGKTLAAEVLANALHLDLYRIDLSAVVSKYIGETEKNLRRIFDVAETGGAVLLFDEADALFGKRSEVNDSHDRYANMEVAYLLQRIESYRGLAILTTNLKDSIDQAFLRRIRFVVQFPFPDAEQREAIWSRVFPPKTPTEGLLYKKLARLNVAGGNIRNIALNAAFLAAETGESVKMQHLLEATKSEYMKLERQLTEPEISGWVPRK